MQPDDTRLITTGLLAVYLGGSEDSFTGLLLNLIAKADQCSKSRLRLAFPEVVHAYEVWMSMEPAPTWAEMTEAMDPTGGKVLPVIRTPKAV